MILKKKMIRDLPDQLDRRHGGRHQHAVEEMQHALDKPKPVVRGEEEQQFTVTNKGTKKHLEAVIGPKTVHVQQYVQLPPDERKIREECNLACRDLLYFLARRLGGRNSWWKDFRHHCERSYGLRTLLGRHLGVANYNPGTQICALVLHSYVKTLDAVPVADITIAAVNKRAMEKKRRQEGGVPQSCGA